MTWNLEEAVSYYKSQGAPGDQTAIIALLREIQREKGGISQGEVGIIAELLGTKTGVLLALIKRIPSLRLSDIHCLELCAGPNCGKHKTLSDAAEKLCKDAKGKIVLKYVPCMRLCGKGPNLRFDSQLHHRADETLIKELLKNL